LLAPTDGNDDRTEEEEAPVSAPGARESRIGIGRRLGTPDRGLRGEEKLGVESNEVEQASMELAEVLVSCIRIRADE